MQTHPVLSPSKRRRCLAALGLAGVLVASCGSDSPSRSAATTTASTEAADTTPETEPSTAPDTAPDTAPVTAPVTTPVTEPTAPSGASLEGEWLVMRQATSNNDYVSESEGGKLPIAYRRYTLTCSNDPCSTLDAEVTLPDGTNGPEALSLTYDGTSLSFDTTSLIACLNAAGTAADGPEVSAQSASGRLDGVVENGAVVSFVGAYSEGIVTIASDQCSAEDISYEADMVMFRADAAAPTVANGAFTGESDGEFRERLLSECDEDSCLLSQVILAVTGDGTARSAQYTWELTGSPAAGYTGSLQYTTSCLDGSGAFVVDPGYDTVHEITAHVYEVAGAGDPILVTSEEMTYTPVAGLTPEHAAKCGPASQTSTLGFGGLPTDTPEVVVPDQVVPGGAAELPPVTLDPAAATESAGDAEPGAFPGTSFGLVVDAATYADALGLAAVADWEVQTYGLSAAFAASKVVLSGGPSESAQSLLVSIGGPFEAAGNVGVMPFAASDGTACALRAVVLEPSGTVALYEITAVPVDCNAYEALFGFEAGSAVPVQG